MALWATSPDPQTLQNKNKTHKEGLGPSAVALRGHLTLNPPKKRNQTKQKKKNERRKTSKTKKYKKWAFSHQPNFSFLVPFGPFLTTWQKKRTPKKHYKIGVSAKHFWKTDVRHETAIFLDQKKPKTGSSSYHLFSYPSTTKKSRTILWNPYFNLVNLKEHGEPPLSKNCENIRTIWAQKLGNFKTAT